MNKGDLVTLIIIVGLLILSFICGIKAMEEECYDKGYTTYTIMPNDTIWSIASDLGGNTEKIVYTIRKDNGIENAGALQIGQQILLRAEY